MVTFSCWLMKTEKCNQTLAFVNAAEIGIRQTRGPWCASSYQTQTINSISYNFHLKETQRWPDHLRILGAQPLEGKVFCFGAGWVSSPLPLNLCQRESGWILRKMQVGGTHRSPSASGLSRIGTKVNLRRNRERGGIGCWRQKLAELLEWLRIQMKVAPTPIYPTHTNTLCRRNAGIGLVVSLNDPWPGLGSHT